MVPLILLVALIVGPALAAILLRVNAAILFMSLCVGELLVQNVSNDTLHILTSSRASSISHSSVELGLLLLPVALTMLFKLHSVHGTKSLLNILPALGFGITGALLVKPSLSPGFQNTLEHANIWHQILQARSFVIAISAAIALFFLWFQHRSRGNSGSGHKTKQH